MQIFAPEILIEGHGLSAGIGAAGVAVGLAVWLTGWWGHRFWIVLATTVAAGVAGLLTSPLHGMKPLLAGVLLAVAAGALALALVRLVVFAAVGGCLALAAHNLAPASLDEPLGWFLVGGLLGLLMFRFWTMLLTSLIGATVMGYSLLSVLDTLEKLDAVALCERQGRLLNAACLTLTATGVLVQFLLERRRKQIEKMKEELETQQKELEEEALYGRRQWLPWGRRRPPFREAG